MSEPRWTKGNRTVSRRGYGARVIAEDGTPLGWHGRNGGMSLEQAHADAALDAAAPKLYDAIELAAHELERLSGIVSAEDCDCIEAVQDAINEAMAAARGKVTG